MALVSLNGLSSYEGLFAKISSEFMMRDHDLSIRYKQLAKNDIAGKHIFEVGTTTLDGSWQIMKILSTLFIVGVERVLLLDRETILAAMIAA